MYRSFTFVLTLLAGVAIAEPLTQAGKTMTLDPNQLFETPKSDLENLQHVREANFGEWVVVELKEPEGAWAIQTINGRFEIHGTVHDNWHDIDLESADQAVNLINTVPVHAMQAFATEEVSKDIIGSGSRNAWFVADASSPETPLYVHALKERDYQLTVLTGHHGQRQAIADRFACSDATTRALVLEYGDVRSLEDTVVDCSTEKQQMTEYFLNVLGITRTPALILHTGRIYQGRSAVRQHLNLN